MSNEKSTHEAATVCTPDATLTNRENLARRGIRAWAQRTLDGYLRPSDDDVELTFDAGEEQKALRCVFESYLLGGHPNCVEADTAWQRRLTAAHDANAVIRQEAADLRNEVEKLRRDYEAVKGINRDMRASLACPEGYDCIQWAGEVARRLNKATRDQEHNSVWLRELTKTINAAREKLGAGANEDTLKAALRVVCERNALADALAGAKAFGAQVKAALGQAESATAEAMLGGVRAAVEQARAHVDNCLTGAQSGEACESCAELLDEAEEDLTAADEDIAALTKERDELRADLECATFNEGQALGMMRLLRARCDVVDGFRQKLIKALETKNTDDVKAAALALMFTV